MSEFKDIPVTQNPRPVRSGEKYTTPQGFTAIKDGVKQPPPGAQTPARNAAEGPVAPAALVAPTARTAQRLPAWLRAPLAAGAGFGAVKQIVREHRLSTVCEEAKCPNIGECWNAGTATIMLMGAVCTRACRFCAVDTGNPRGWLDAEEPENVAKSVELMRLKYVVLTSVNRDDLADGGASHYAAAVRAIKRRNPGTAVEALTPDFQGVIETVRRLTHPVRDPRAGYEQTLGVLREAKAYKAEVLTKTSLMLGLGETDAEIRETLIDLRAAQVQILTLGQYLRPTPNHLTVERFVTPQEFDQYRSLALELGFLECVSGPLVRSSYRAEQALARNNAGLDNVKLAAKAAGGRTP
jgi:lipoyl synthase